jgi:hypothetical protein
MRMWGWVVVTVGMGLFAGSLTPVIDSANASDKPNIILIVADDYGWPDYGFMQRYLRRKLCTDGSPDCVRDLGKAYEQERLLWHDDAEETTPPLDRVVTPALDSLAETGIYFPVAHSSASRCRPSYVSILTGLYMRDLDRTRPSTGREVQKETFSPAMPELLDPAYLTMGAGKYWKGTFVEERVVGSGDLLVRSRQLFDAKRPKTNHNRTILKGALADVKGFIDCALCTKRGVACQTFDDKRADSPRMQARQTQCDPAPFFIFLSSGLPHAGPSATTFCDDFPRDKAQCEQEPYKTHSMYCAKGGFPEGLPCPFSRTTGREILRNMLRTDRDGAKALGKIDRYLDLANMLDRSIDELLVFLEARNQRDNTLILYATDNGAHLRGGKSRFSEHGYRMPIIVNHPGQTPTGNCDESGGLPGCRTEFAHATDLMGTVLAAGGCAGDECVSTETTGRVLGNPSTLAGSCRGTDNPNMRQCLFGQQAGQQTFGDQFPGRYVLAEIADSTGGVRLCKYYRDCPGFAAELYDLSEDPDETCELLRNKRGCAGPTPFCPQYQPALGATLGVWAPDCGGF